MAQWPIIYNRLLTWMPARPAFAACPVYDGPEIDGQQTDTFCTVGYVRESSGGDGSAGTFSQDRSGNGFQTVETGVIHGEIYAGNGDGNLAAARTAAFALVDDIQAGLVADQTLGILPQGTSMWLTVDPLSPSTAAGVAQWLPLSINYIVTT